MDAYSGSDLLRTKGQPEAYDSKTPVANILERYRPGTAASRPPSAGGAPFSHTAPHSQQHWSPAKAHPKYTPRTLSPSKRTNGVKAKTPGEASASRRAVADILSRYSSPGGTAPRPSDLTTRIRHLAGGTGRGGGGPTARRSPIASNTYDKNDKEVRDENFRIGAVRTTADLNIALHGSQLVTASSRANELQAQLQVRDLEVQRLQDDAAAMRKERDALQSRLTHRLADLDSSQQARLSLELAAKQAQREADAARAAAAAAKAESEALRANIALLSQQRQEGSSSEASALQLQLAELRVANAELQQKLDRREAEVKEERQRAEQVQEKCQAGEALVRALQRQLEDMEMMSDERRSPLFQEARRLASELQVSEKRCAAAEAALKEERTRNSNRHEFSEAGHKAETALTHQVRTLAAQLKEVQQEATDLRRQLVSQRSTSQDEQAALESKTADLMSSQRRAEAALHAAEGDLIAKAQQLEEVRGTVNTLTEENAALHAALRQRDAEISKRAHSAADTGSRVEALEREVVRLQSELRSSKMRVVELEDLLTRSGGSNHTITTTAGPSSSTMPYMDAPPGHSPLRDMVGTLRSELDDRELRLAAALEEAETERRRAEEMQRRLLDQALELDDLQDRAVPLRQQLQMALDGQRAAEQKAKALENALEEERYKGASNAKVQALAAELQGARDEVASLKKERDDLIKECEARDTEFMQLQGRLHMMEGHTETENWLMTP